MFSKTIKSIISTFITAATETARVTGENIQALEESRMYSREYLDQERAKIWEANSVALEMLRDKAISELTVVFDNARAVISNSIAETARSGEIEELKNILDASSGNLSEFEISVILEKVAGNYWALRMLDNAIRDESDARKILKEKFTAPNPEHYERVLDREESTLAAFIKTYDGKEVTSHDHNTATGIILMDGDHFERLHQLLSINTAYLTDDDLTAPSLRAAERRTLRKSGITLDTSDKTSKQLVTKAARKGGMLRNLLMRTCWADVINEESRKMMEEAEANAQIKYKGAWRDLAGAVGGMGV